MGVGLANGVVGHRNVLGLVVSRFCLGKYLLACSPVESRQWILYLRISQKKKTHLCLGELKIGNLL